jgi:hypothetical protein
MLQVLISWLYRFVLITKFLTNHSIGHVVREIFFPEHFQCTFKFYVYWNNNTNVDLPTIPPSPKYAVPNQKEESDLQV